MAYQHIIDSERCKGCGLCVDVCPKNVLEISDKVNVKGHFPAFQARPEDCIYCTMCCIMCPDVAVSIVEIPAAKNQAVQNWKKRNQKAPRNKKVKQTRKQP